MDDESKIFGFLGYFLSIIGFIIVLIAKKDDKYAMHYGKQGLALFILSVVAIVINFILGLIPFFGWIVAALVHIGVLVIWIIGIVYSLSGEIKEIPIVGEISRKYLSHI